MMSFFNLSITLLMFGCVQLSSGSVRPQLKGEISQVGWCYYYSDTIVVVGNLYFNYFSHYYIQWEPYVNVVDHHHISGLAVDVVREVCRREQFGCNLTNDENDANLYMYPDVNDFALGNWLPGHNYMPLSVLIPTEPFFQDYEFAGLVLRSTALANSLCSLQDALAFQNSTSSSQRVYFPTAYHLAYYIYCRKDEWR